MSLAPGACAGISAESEAGSPLGGPSAPKRGTFQADWLITTPPAWRVRSEIQSAGYARRRRLLRDCGRGFNSRRLHSPRPLRTLRLRTVQRLVPATTVRIGNRPRTALVRRSVRRRAAPAASPASAPLEPSSCRPPDARAAACCEAAGARVTTRGG